MSIDFLFQQVFEMIHLLYLNFRPLLVYEESTRANKYSFTNNRINLLQSYLPFHKVEYE